MSVECRAPKSMNFDGNVAAAWKEFKFQFDVYMETAGFTTFSNKRKVFVLLNLLGEEGQAVYRTFDFDNEDDKLNYAKVVEKFDEFCLPKKNVNYELFKFMTRKQQEGETFDQYYTALKKLSQNCELGDKTDPVLLAVLLAGLSNSNARQELLKDPNITLKQGRDYILADQASRSHAEMMEKLRSDGETTANLSIDGVIKYI